MEKTTTIKVNVMHAYKPLILMKPEGSIKICHMNNSIQVDRSIDGQWITEKVLPSNSGIPTGIHQLADAKPAAGGVGHQVFNQNVLFVDKKHVYQFSGDKGIVRHDRSLFRGEPKMGVAYNVEYENGRGVPVEVSEQEHGNKQVEARPRMQPQIAGLSR